MNPTKYIVAGVGISILAALIAGEYIPCSEQHIRPAVELKKGQERANEKADEIVRCHTIGIFENVQYGVRMEIRSIEKIEGGIQVFARAWQGTKQLGFGKDGTTEWERFRIYNPPILVSDPTGDIIRTEYDKNGKITREFRFREDHMQALQDTLAHTMKVSGRTDTIIVPESMGNTTSTFFPDPSVESTSVDGWAGVDPPSCGTFTTQRDAAGNSGSDTAATLQASLGTGGCASDTYGQMDVAITLFDTSAIADTDTVDSGTLSFFGSTKVDNFAQSVVATNSNPASNTAVVAGDYTTHVAEMGTEVGTARITVANWSTTAYNDYTLTAGGVTLISKTGISKYGFRLSGDFDNTAPTWTGDVGGNARSHSADAAGTSNDPKLVVVHSAAAVAAPIPQDQTIWFE